ncbi:MAG: hypothetical protein JG777_1318 [Clostridia bacterium]|jgi:hypothetical protein|nr:hypothetical protein [Petroclostridium xylanilyticum]MBZ4645829.1 hypothetical protein [Clostridia bacterium]
MIQNNAFKLKSILNKTKITTLLMTMEMSAWSKPLLLATWH